MLPSLRPVRTEPGEASQGAKVSPKTGTMWRTTAQPTAAFPLLYALWLLGTFAPSLVALALTARKYGTTGVRTLIGRIFQWRLAVRWYVFAISYVAVIKLIVAVAHRMVIGAWPRFGHDGPVVMLVAILLSTPVQSGEEVGWRGYALPRLAQSMGYARGELLLGVLWACWHLPQFFVAAADTYRQSFPVWSLQVIALSVTMAWLYTKSNGSLLLMMLMHAAVNNTKDIVPSAVSNPAGTFSLHASLVMYLTVAVLWIAAIYFLVRLPKFEVQNTYLGDVSNGQSKTVDF